MRGFRRFLVPEFHKASKDKFRTGGSTISLSAVTNNFGLGSRCYPIEAHTKSFPNPSRQSVILIPCERP
jgi:hypothetical protein